MRKDNVLSFYVESDGNAEGVRGPLPKNSKEPCARVPRAAVAFHVFTIAWPVSFSQFNEPVVAVVGV